MTFLVRGAFILTALLALTSCLSSGFSETTNSPATTTEDTPAVFKSTILNTGSYSDAAGISRNYDLIKLEYGSEKTTYAQWIPNKAGATVGTVLMYFPYEGIDWTGEAIDTAWSTKSGYSEDVDAPYYVNGTSSGISYTLITPAAAAGEGFPYSYTGLNVLIVYGRYYTGSTVQDSANDVQKGLRYLHSRTTLVDNSKIALYSGSWGGVGVLFGAAQIEASLRPSVIALAYPVSDLKKLNTRIETTIPTLTVNSALIDAYNAFWDPYKRRLNKATESLTGQSTRYDNYTHSKLSALNQKFFIAHDEWDTLVPFSHSVDLLNTVASTDKITLYHVRNGALDIDTADINHSQSTNEMTRSAMLGWLWTYVIGELTPSTAARSSFYSSSELITQFNYMKAMKTAGKDVSAYNKVLGLLCQENLTMGDADNSFGGNSKDIFFVLMENLWQNGWAADGPSACAKLLTNPPF
jgi:Prolyl oligopeptidase family.